MERPFRAGARLIAWLLFASICGCAGGSGTSTVAPVVGGGGGTDSKAGGETVGTSGGDSTGAPDTGGASTSGADISSADTNGGAGSDSAAAATDNGSGGADASHVVDAGPNADAAGCSAGSCDDTDGCTDDMCDPTTKTCKFSFNSAKCDDGNACTSADKCSAGKCVGGPDGCDDGNACTADSCDKTANACVNKQHNKPCSDGNGCTVGDSCAKGTCSAGKGKDCDDGDKCTEDACDAKTGSCTHTKKAGCTTVLPPCDPALGLGCSSGVCHPTRRVCVACLKAADCGPSSYLCRKQACVATTSCKSSAACKTTSQVCDKKIGACVDCVGAADCAAGQLCVENACVSAAACKSDKDCPAICDKSAGHCVGCVTADDCKSGYWCAPWQQCVPAACSGSACGKPTAPGKSPVHFICSKDGSGYEKGKTCQDNSPCKKPSCDAGKGCQYTADDKGSCSDGNPCTNDKCAGGKCTSLPSKVGTVCGPTKACDGKGGCSMCQDAKMAPPGCNTCLDPKFTGPKCDKCADPKFTGPKCDKCADPKFGGPKCDQTTKCKATDLACLNACSSKSCGSIGATCSADKACVWLSSCFNNCNAGKSPPWPPAGFTQDHALVPAATTPTTCVAKCLNSVPIGSAASSLAASHCLHSKCVQQTHSAPCPQTNAQCINACAYDKCGATLQACTSNKGCGLYMACLSVIQGCQGQACATACSQWVLKKEGAGAAQQAQQGYGAIVACVQQKCLGIGG